MIFLIHDFFEGSNKEILKYCFKILLEYKTGLVFSLTILYWNSQYHFRISPGTIEVDGWQLTVWVNELVLVIGTGGRGVLTILLDGVDFDMEMEFFMVAKRSTMWLKTRIAYYEFESYCIFRVPKRDWISLGFLSSTWNLRTISQTKLKPFKRPWLYSRWDFRDSFQKFVFHGIWCGNILKLRMVHISEVPGPFFWKSAKCDDIWIFLPFWHNMLLMWLKHNNK